MDVNAYRVRRWTAFTWKSDQSDPEAFAARAAGLFAGAMVARYPNMQSAAWPCRVDNVPQIMFELIVYAETEADAMRRACYRIERSLTTKFRIEGHQRRLEPPWGKVTVERA